VRRVHSVRMGPATQPDPGFQGPSGLTWKQKAPQKRGYCSNEPCWTRTNDHRIKSAMT
jgi:hypothetical protein